MLLKGVANTNQEVISNCGFLKTVFIPETSGLKDTTQVENLQDQALAMLRNHIESSSPSNTTRFGRLLMLLANLRFGNAQRIEKTFFEKIIGNAKMEKLLCDMFQS